MMLARCVSSRGRAGVVYASCAIVGLSLWGCTSLEPIPDELDPAAYSCVQRYEPSGDPMRQKDGELAPASEFLAIDRSADALAFRQALADEATTSLDIQYFLWRTDDTGVLLMRHVIDAAERGVRVRVLMDDLDSVAWNERAVALNMHPNFEIRVFNPFKKRRGGWGQRAPEMISDVNRLNHRMHNKLFMADSRLAIVGGRNIGDEYFGAGSPLSYRDYDVITIGPVVEELTESFNTFWHSAWSYPLEDLRAKDSDTTWQDVRDEVEAQVKASTLLADEYEVAPESWSELISEARDGLTSGRARALFDCPPSGDGKQFPVLTAYTLSEVAAMASESVLIVSPYVVPLENLRQEMRRRQADGLEVTIYTNSLAAADHTYAFSGYSKYRPELLDMGVQLRELMPDAAISSIQQVASSPADYQALHAKLSVFDRRWVYIGSFNLDPRSAHWNTELGLLIDSPEFAALVLEDFAADLHDDSTWRVELRREEGKKKGRLYWINANGETNQQPARGAGQRFSNWFYSLFPLDEQL